MSWKHAEKRDVIFDLDGTLGDDQWRRYFIEKEGWESYFLKGASDVVVAPVRDFFFMMKTMKIGCHIVTNRPEMYRGLTEEWLRSWKIQPDTLSMRPNGHYVDGNQVVGGHADDKLRRAYSLGLVPDTVLFCLDDMDESVLGWRKAGYDCWQVRSQGLVF